MLSWPRDGEGKCLGWQIRCFSGQPPAVVGEARAAYEGVQWALEKGWSGIILQGDNLEVLTAVQNRVEDDLLPYGVFISSILSSSHLFSSFSSSFIKRTGNMLAHALAHFSISPLVCLDDVELPADLAHII